MEITSDKMHQAISQIVVMKIVVMKLVWNVFANAVCKFVYSYFVKFCSKDEGIILILE